MLQKQAINSLTAQYMRSLKTKNTQVYIGEKVCVRYDRNDPSNVRIYDTEDRYLFSWECADWLITRYFDESKEKLAELGRGQADVIKQIKARSIELKGNSGLTQKNGLKYLAKQNAGKFNIQMPKNIIPVIVNEETPELKQAVGAEDIAVEINLRTIAQSATERKEW